MSYNEKDDELQRMRERRTGTGTPRKRPAARRTQQEWDEAYSYEEEYESRPRRPARTVSAAQNTRSASASAGNGARTAAGGRARAVPSRTQAGRGGSQRETEYETERSASRNGRATQGGRRRRAGKKRGAMLLRLLPLLILVVLVYFGYQLLHRPTGYWNIAVFGVDSRDGSTDKALADVQMICSVNRESGEIRLVSVYRDTYLKIDSKGTYHKINEAYFKGGHTQAVAALEENLDLKIDDYATFNWKAVADAINILGGIDLEISDSEFKYINAFITETVESTGVASVHLKQAGMNHLDGVQAVAYCRLRLMDTDFQRTERQRKVVDLALAKAKEADFGTLTTLVQTVIPQISTSIGVNDLLPLAKGIRNYHIGETGGFPFSRQTAKVGKMDCVIATTLESNDKLLHQFLYGEDVSYTPSAAVKKISAAISEETGLYEEGQPAPSGSSAGGSSGGSKSSGGKAGKAAEPSQTAPSAEETTEAETTAEETEQDTERETIEELENAKETDEEETTRAAGPGVSHETTKPSAEKETQEIGPGVSQGSGAGPSGSSENSGNETNAVSPGSAPGASDGSHAAGPGAEAEEAGPGIS